MNINTTVLLAAYLIVISAVTVIVTCSDKLRAERGKYRVPEKTLMLLGLFGGAGAEYVTMKIIRHKTHHKKFMIGLPVEIVLHLIIIFVIAWFSLH